MLRRRAFLATAAAFGLMAPLSARAALPGDIVQQVERYLNNIETLRAKFTQIAPNGRLSEGRVYLHRPGRMRFEYDPPETLLMVATDWRVVMQDTRTRQTNTIPVNRTPLGLLLDERVQLSGPVTIRDMAEIGGELHMTLFKTEEPGLGELQLVFGLRPLELRRWQVLDAQGKVTQILLEDVETNVRLQRNLFTLIQ
ncbi:MAG: outer membrane lipoprotein carrier protein LolA [Geminicoccaceae bacterium]|nr:MAG: outer membrane lipoprotein carrier protein LolA [Geminicoccaceae bacterium]